MDAASNNSVEDIRSIREEVNFLPTKAKYRVYIIDEVHMLSTGAFNALLKTLEEPPAHVKFILATTEPQKLPATILSRCQRFDFKKISEEDIIKRLQVICSKSNISITEEALRTIAILSEGGMRDAISILERCLQDGDTEIVDDKIKDLVGIPKIEYINKITESIIDKDEEKALNTIEEVINDGKDLYNFLWEIIKYVKDVLLFKVQGKVNLYNSDDLEKIKSVSEKASKDELFYVIYELSELENDIKWSTQKNIMFEAGILKLIAKKKHKVYKDVEERLDKLEEKINSGDFTISSNKDVKADLAEKVSKKDENIKKETKKDETPNKPVKRLQSENYWKEVVNILKSKGKITLFTNLMNAKAAEVNDMQLAIVGLSAFGKKIVEQPENRKEIEEVLQKKFPYKVPDGYFSALEDELAKKIKAKEDYENNSLLTKLKPAFAMVATFAIILGLGYGVMTATKNLGDRSYSAEAENVIGMENVLEEAVADYSLIETIEQIYYLEQADTLSSDMENLEEELINNYLLSELNLVTLLSFE